MPTSAAASPTTNSLRWPWPGWCPQQPCARYQFLGEFLHAYADTFSHRDASNTPFDAIALGLGLGHGLAAGSEPDYTFDGDPNYQGGDSQVNANHWNVRAQRTLVALQAVFNVLQTHKDPASTGVSFDTLRPMLEQFVAIQENEGNTGAGFPKKKELLTNTLQRLIQDGKIKPVRADGTSVQKIDLTRDQGAEGFSYGKGETNRNQFLAGLSEADYPGVCLPGGTRCTPY